MKNLFKIGLLALTMAILTTSCDKTDVDTIIVNNTPDTVDFNPLVSKMQFFSNDTLNISCVAIPFPVDFLKQSGSVVSVNDTTDLSAALMNGDSLIDFVYPVQVYVNGISKTIQNIQELATEVAFCDTTILSCADLEAHVLLFYNGLNIFTINRYPYTINYPVQIEVNGQLIVLNQDSDYLPAIGGNPMQPGSASLVYPIVIEQFGQTITLNDDLDVCNFYSTLDENCSNKPGHIQFFFNEGAGTVLTCAYFVNYPVQGTLNGTNVVFQSLSDYTTLLETDPSVYNGLSLTFPVSAEKFQSGQTLIFNSDADICQFLTTCN